METNDAGVAVLLGLRLGAAHLQSLPPILRQARLPELVDIEDARRLNLTGDEVIRKMEEAEQIYAAMAIPFHVAVFNEFLVTALEMLQADGQVAADVKPQKLMLGDLRQALGAAGVALPQDQEKLLNFAQKLRNSIVHDGGVVRIGIRDIWSGLTTEQQAIWIEDAGRAPVLVTGERVELAPGEVNAVLATTTHLGKAVIDELERLVSRKRWTQIAVEDWIATVPEKWPDWERRARNAQAYARHEYASLKLTLAEIETELSARA